MIEAIERPTSTRGFEVLKHIETAISNTAQPRVIHREILTCDFSLSPRFPISSKSMAVEEESELIEQQTEVFLRDVYDHTLQVIDTLEIFRDNVSGLMDVYLSSVSNRMNEVRKVLTIIATIFIPLTFITGIYGMNFEYMPELEITWAYPIVWLTMLIVAAFMMVYFKTKNWI